MTKRRDIRKAVFPVAGLGTRFLPATKSVPKEIMTLVDRSLIQYAIDEARAAWIEEFIFVTSRGKSALEDYFDEAPLLQGALQRTNKHDLLAEIQRTNMPSGAFAYGRSLPLNNRHGAFAPNIARVIPHSCLSPISHRSEHSDTLHQQSSRLA